jgi:hypothetical protein
MGAATQVTNRMGLATIAARRRAGGVTKARVR